MQLARTHSRRPTVAPRLAGAVLALACALGTAGAGLAIEPVVPTADEEASDAADAVLGWSHLEVVADGFRALLPGDDRWEEAGLRETIAGTVSETKYFGRAEGRTFSIGLHRLPNLSRFFAPTGLVLSTAKKNVLRTESGRELSYERRRFGDHPGALLTLERPREDDEAERVEVQLVLVGQRLYVLKASDPDAGGDRSDVDRFFASFEVIE